MKRQEKIKIEEIVAADFIAGHPRLEAKMRGARKAKTHALWRSVLYNFIFMPVALFVMLARNSTTTKAVKYSLARTMGLSMKSTIKRLLVNGENMTSADVLDVLDNMKIIYTILGVIDGN